MKVLISLVQMRPGNSGGIAPYAINLAYNLANDYPDVDVHLIETFFNHKYFCEMPEDRCTRHLIRQPYKYRDETIELIKKIKPDVVFYPVAGGDPIFSSESTKFVVCIADLQHLTFPEFFSSYTVYNRNKAFSDAVNLSQHIVTLSQHAKSSICDAYNLGDTQVSVVSPALDKSYFSEKKLTPKQELMDTYNVPEEYIFYPANFWQHKNHANLFKAIKILNDEGLCPSLVMTGDLFGERPELTELINELDIKNNIFILGYLKMDDVNALVKYAKIIAFPSLFEGFGIPVLEAFANRTPLCCSNVTSLPEVAGDGALLFDPLKPDEIAGAIKKLYSDDRLCKKLVAAGERQLSTFSYKNSAKVLYEVFQSLIEQPDDVPEESVLSDNPLVTIVTPSYNQVEFIEETIKSVLSQSYKNIEYIVMDGGSSDGTVEILKKYTDKIKWVSESDGGQTDAINKGLKNSSGDYFCYLNSDDTLEVDAVKSMLLFLESNPEYSMVYGDADYIDKNGGFISAYETYDWDFNMFKGHCFICQPATMWRKKTIDDFGYFDDSLHYIMDYEYWLRIAHNDGKIGYLPEKLANSRLYDETKTLSGRDKIFREIFDISNKMFGSASFQWHKAYAQYLIYEKFGFLNIRHGSTLSKLLIGLILLFRQPSGVYKLLKEKLKRLKFLVRNKLIGFVNRFKLSNSIGTQQTVTGMYSDGWVSNSMEIDYGEKKALTEILIEGESHQSQSLTIAVDDCVTKKHINAGAFSLQLVVDSNYVKNISVHSDVKVSEGESRELAYILTYTNLFTDLDVAWKI